MKRNISLDFIKIVAMYSVLALHIGFATNCSPCFLTRYWWSFFGVAIPLFFMVSGYLMESKTVDLSYSLRKVCGILKYVFLTITPFVVYQLIQGNLSALKYYYSWIRQGSPLSIYWYFAAMIIVYVLLPTIKRIMNSKYQPLFLAILFLTCQVVFVLNILCDFERTYVYQAFRIWNWLFYFSLGMIVNRHQEWFDRINWFHTIVYCLFFLAFRRVLSRFNLGNEYYFCSLPNMAYVLCLFLCLKKVDFGEKSRKIISHLSIIFLPVYTIHWPIFLYCKDHGIQLELPDPNLSIIANYIVFASFITLISLLVMRLPYAKQLFKI